MLSRKIGFLIYDKFNAMDLVGPLEVFSTAKELGGVDYQTIIIGKKTGPYVSENGLTLVSDSSFDDIQQLDTLIIPGGQGARDTDVQKEIKSWLELMLTATRRYASVCTGAYLLASVGALDNKQATTHWHFLEDFQARFPKVKVNNDAIFVVQGAVATSAGISSGIDLCLKLVEDDCGTDLAIKVARHLVVHYRRSGNQAQYSEPLQHQARSSGLFSKLIGWILQDLSQDLSVEKLAEEAGMSPRNFCRKFKQQFGDSPARHIELLRLDYARQLLTDKDWQIDKIATLCGYQNTDVFRRAFERRFIIAPSTYRAQFNSRYGMIKGT